MSPEQIAELEAELARLKGEPAPQTAQPATDAQGVILNLQVPYSVGSDVKWRPLKKRKVDPERLIWGASARRGLRIG